MRDSTRAMLRAMMVTGAATPGQAEEALDRAEADWCELGWQLDAARSRLREVDGVTLGEEVEIVVPGPPVPLARPRVTRSGHAYTPRRASEHKESIALAARRVGVKPGPVESVALTFHLPCPKTIGGRRARRDAILGRGAYSGADTDNLAKCVLDALEGLAYPNDREIHTIMARKVLWSGDPHTRIRIRYYPDSLRPY